MADVDEVQKIASGFKVNLKDRINVDPYSIVLSVKKIVIETIVDYQISDDKTLNDNSRTFRERSPSNKTDFCN